MYILTTTIAYFLKMKYSNPVKLFQTPFVPEQSITMCCSRFIYRSIMFRQPRILADWLIEPAMVVPTKHLSLV